MAPTDDDTHLQGGVRRLQLLGELRLTWQLTVADPEHPAFLPLGKLAAARAYVFRLGLLELEFPSLAVESLDAQIHFARFTRTWDYDDDIPLWHWRYAIQLTY